MLIAISGYATWSVMSAFIVGVSQSPAAQGREIPGGLSITNEAPVIAVVTALRFLMWLPLREIFAAKRNFSQRLITFPLYFFLALWSARFGYGFWWGLIAGEEATWNGLSNLQEDARDAGAAVTARLNAVKAQLEGVVSWSETQMAREETSRLPPPSTDYRVELIRFWREGKLAGLAHLAAMAQERPRCGKRSAPTPGPFPEVSEASYAASWSRTSSPFTVR